jgi:NitT/TauT family transport system ATP-binding protein
MTGIWIDNLYKSFEKDGEQLHVLSDISMSLEGNRFVSVVGPSGCGKSTLLRIIAGLVPADSGSVRIEGEVSYLQQNSPLMPWRDLYGNVALPLEIKYGKSKQNEDRVRSLIKEFGLEGFEKYLPGEISGGMAKRAALMRTYLEESDIMLLDEPFSSLDAITKKKLGSWLLEIWNNHKKGVVFVTHDIEEALFLSDKVYVMGENSTGIMDSLDVGFERPRDKDIIYSQEFIEMKKKIEKMLISGS